MNRIFNMIIISLLIIASIMGSNFVCAATWYSMESGTTNDLHGIWGSSGSNVFAVGNRGTILHYNGGSWSAMASGTTNGLYGVWGSSGNNVYAVGDNGLILHYDGSNWTSMTSGTSNILNCVWGSTSADIYAGGYNNTLLHYDGTIWEPAEIDWEHVNDYYTTLDIMRIWGGSANNIFLVAHPHHLGGEILHYNGTTWYSLVPSPPIESVGDIWVSSGMDIFITGYAWPLSPEPKIGHYNGTGWDMTDVGVGVNAIWGRSSNDIFAVGNTIYHYDGSLWSGTDISAINSKSLNDIWGSSGIDVFSVGDAGTILRYGETTQIILSSFTALPFNKKISVGWKTESEINNAGFNLYRAEKENGEYLKINVSLIPAKGSSTQGASYEFTDTNLQNRKTYYYKLEDIDLSGTSTMHGPVNATPRLIYGMGK